jgi:hypothetical protein
VGGHLCTAQQKTATLKPCDCFCRLAQTCTQQHGCGSMATCLCKASCILLIIITHRIRVHKFCLCLRPGNALAFLPSTPNLFRATHEAMQSHIAYALFFYKWCRVESLRYMQQLRMDTLKLSACCWQQVAELLTSLPCTAWCVYPPSSPHPLPPPCARI